MCGIAGIVDYRNKAPNKNVIERMLRAVCYRGPDESGTYSSPFVTLGHARLSIIDLSTGQQPLSDASGRYWIVFNGEIFNYPELRDNLVKERVYFPNYIRHRGPRATLCSLRERLLINVKWSVCFCNLG